MDHGGNFVITAQDPKGPWSVPHYLGDAAEGIDPSLFLMKMGNVIMSGQDRIRPGSDTMVTGRSG